MCKSFTLLLIIFSLSFTGLHSQDYKYRRLHAERYSLPAVTVKTNLLYDLTTTINLGAEMYLSDYLTLDLSVSYNPWEFPDNRKFKHILVQPELRYWIYEPFNGHYLGGHLLYSNYNTGNLHLPLDILPGLKDYRYRGNAYGLGFSYGYQWILSNSWNLEATFGFGYMYMDYSRYECKTCGKKLEDGSKHYFGPTRAGISLIYIIK
ncbi:MAG: DUF3575 domain-containing protein [Prevotella sp.]|jgi:hypothetical protein|nr:DUF3575 domain-containing protein [Prevotella sp.]